MEVKYRRIHEDELDELLRLYKQLLPDGEPLPADEYVLTVWQEILNDKKMSILVAEAENRIVGSCVLTIIPNLTHGCTPYGFMENMITDENYRGKGIGTGLLKYGLALAWEKGCSKVMGLTGRQTEQIFHFYENAGFKRGVKTGFIIKREDVK